MKLGFRPKVSYIFRPGVGHKHTLNASIFLAVGAKVFVDAADPFSGDAILVMLEI